MKRDESNVDNEKRGKLLLLAAIVALSMFIYKIIARESLPIWRVFLDGGLYFVGVFVGLLFSLNFQVKKKSMLFITQASLFVLSQSLFIDFFFFQKFNRIYEAFILLLLIIVVFFANYFVFLMVNTLNVNQFKPIPLAQVGRTISYLSSIFMVYAFTFAFLISGLPVYIIFPSIVLLYFIISLLHYINIEIDGAELLRKSLITALIMSVLLAAIVSSGNFHEIISFVPVVGYYLSVNTVTHEKLFNGHVEYFNRYIFLLILILFLILFFNIKG